MANIRSLNNGKTVIASSVHRTRPGVEPVQRTRDYWWTTLPPFMPTPMTDELARFIRAMLIKKLNP